MNKNSLNFVTEGAHEVFYIWSEPHQEFHKYLVTHKIAKGIVKCSGIDTRKATTQYYCYDTHKIDTGIFMLKDDVWNAITPDFKQDGIVVNRGFLCIEACAERCMKYLKRQLQYDDFDLNDSRNEPLLFGCNFLHNPYPYKREKNYLGSESWTFGYGDKRGYIDSNVYKINIKLEFELASGYKYGREYDLENGYITKIKI